MCTISIVSLPILLSCIFVVGGGPKKPKSSSLTKNNKVFFVAAVLVSILAEQSLLLTHCSFTDPSLLLHCVLNEEANL